jgi:hypothetical protein
MRSATEMCVRRRRYAGLKPKVLYSVAPITMSSTIQIGCSMPGAGLLTQGVPSRAPWTKRSWTKRAWTKRSKIFDLSGSAPAATATKGGSY